MKHASLQDNSIKYLLEEYKNIALTHDKLRDTIARIFNYFLIINAFPFTVVGIVFRDRTFDLFDAPLSLHLLFLAVGLINFFIGLSIAEARLEQFMYAKTVNNIRKYFADLDASLKAYLYLPISVQVPSLNNLGFVGKQILLIQLVGAMFCAYAIEEVLKFHLTDILIWRIVLFVVGFLLYVFIFKILLYKLKEKRKKIHNMILERLEKK
jgi:hypothetical protein